MSKFVDICQRCGNTFPNTNERRLPYCSVGCSAAPGPGVLDVIDGLRAQLAAAEENLKAEYRNYSQVSKLHKGACRDLEAMTAERDALRDEVERLKGNAETDAVNTDWMGADNDRLRAALREYGQHDGNCRCGYRDPDPTDCGVTRGEHCTCGLDAAINGAGGEH